MAVVYPALVGSAHAMRAKVISTLIKITSANSSDGIGGNIKADSLGVGWKVIHVVVEGLDHAVVEIIEVAAICLVI